MSTTRHILANGNFIQDWNNVSLITTDGNWNGIPSIVGYRGDDLTTATGTDPQTILADGSGTPVNVEANETNPTTFNTGGVIEFEIANPTIALNGSGTADAPHIVLYLDSIGRQNVTLTFNARDLDASADNATQQIAVQYRIGDSGNFINLPSGFVPDATTQGTATQVTAVSVTLPAAANNQSDLQIRIITTNAGGNDELVGIDDINVSSQAIVGPTPASVTISDASITEGDGGTQTLTFTISRSDNTGTFSVDYTTANGTATAPSDYVAVTGAPNTLNFTAGGALSQQVSITINGDIANEADETFTVNLGNLVNSTGAAIDRRRNRHRHDPER